jgi:hypothetical protein
MQTNKGARPLILTVAILWTVIAGRYLMFGGTRTSRFAKPYVPRVLDAESAARLWAHVAAVRDGCGAICDTSLAGTPGPFVDFIQKPFQCRPLWANKAIDAPRVGSAPFFPEEIRDLYTYGHRIPVTHLDENPLDQVYLGNREPLVWAEVAINDWATKCEAGNLEGNYGFEETRWVMGGLRAMTTIVNGRVLVIGSENPWVEACVLAAGAKEVTTLEYREITSLHPKVNTLTPDAARSAFLAGSLPLFDAIVTFSSVEHSGLGRYGDALNPWGDLQAIARAWCITRSGGEMLIGVMYDKTDRIEWNAHRVYGPLMMSHLLANWVQVWRAGGGWQVVHVVRKPLDLYLSDN